MEENESEGNTEKVDISNALKELLSVVREQKSELSSLKEEVRGNTASVASEVKKLKTVNEMKWKYEGNKIVQFQSRIGGKY
jgi:hypothetical protein